MPVKRILMPDDPLIVGMSMDDWYRENFAPDNVITRAQSVEGIMPEYEPYTDEMMVARAPFSVNWRYAMQAVTIDFNGGKGGGRSG